MCLVNIANGQGWPLDRPRSPIHAGLVYKTCVLAMFFRIHNLIATLLSSSFLTLIAYHVQVLVRPLPLRHCRLCTACSHRTADLRPNREPGE